MVERRKHLTLTEDDISNIVLALQDKLQTHLPHDFYIPPEEHYLAHKNIGELYKDWRTIKDTFTKAFVGFMIVGVMAFAAAGALLEGLKYAVNLLKGH